MQEEAGASFLGYGPADAGVEIAQDFGAFELEYGALRKGAAVLDMPQRGVVEVTGGERHEFLQRMLTAQVDPMEAGTARRSFILTPKGKIVADLLVLAEAERLMLHTDVWDAPTVVAELEKRRFVEDVTLTDRSGETWTITVHGPQAAKLLETAGIGSVADLRAWQHRRLHWQGQALPIARRDEVAAPGFHLLAPRDHAERLFGALAEALGGLQPETEGGAERPVTGRAVGWLAYNTARIEAGTALFHVDFGPDSLPHETQLTEETVDFEKGCYIGQEVVAMMKDRGHPPRVLVRLEGEDQRLPVAGGQVHPPEAADEAPGAGAAEAVGAVTSSTLSPMRGQRAIALAMVKWRRHEPGTRLGVAAEGGIVPMTVVAS
jgi:folate-binding protein YgfZ